MPRDDASNTEYHKDNAWVDSALIVCTVRSDTKEEADVALFITLLQCLMQEYELLKVI